MKKALLSLGVALMAFVGSTAMAQEGTPVALQENGPVITVDKELHDYGTIENGSDGSCVFKVTNTGTAPLIISTCQGSCGCTVPDCPKKPITPGATAEIKVTYDTKRTGPFNKSVTITSNAVNAPSKRVKIKGVVKAKASSSSTTTPPSSN
ncbi:MAG: DUF1573 domain-containing protein [Crocinitomicaceae bacterium]